MMITTYLKFDVQKPGDYLLFFDAVVVLMLQGDREPLCFMRNVSQISKLLYITLII